MTDEHVCDSDLQTSLRVQRLLLTWIGDSPDLVAFELLMNEFQGCARCLARAVMFLLGSSVQMMVEHHGAGDARMGLEMVIANLEAQIRRL
jgi:hypothetical protein